MNKMAAFHIRNMTLDEVTTIAVPWAANEGWNPGLYDAGCYYQTDPKGYWIGLLDHEPIACISIVSYGSHFAFLGFYIVKPEYRGMGFGLQIWETAISNFKGWHIGLDGVLAQQANYRKSGFVYAYSNVRYQGLAMVLEAPFEDVVPIVEVPFEKLVKYDAQMFPTTRTQFLSCWIQQPEGIAFGVVRDDNLVGYGVIRKCLLGYKIGPLFADNEKIADRLFLSLIDFAEPKAPVFLDTPDSNSKALSLAKRYQMEAVFGTARMYTMGTPDMDIHRVFGVTTFELG
jgi:GNAT superfamily N-acetyltransferase